MQTAGLKEILLIKDQIIQILYYGRMYMMIWKMMGAGYSNFPVFQFNYLEQAPAIFGLGY